MEFIWNNEIGYDECQRLFQSNSWIMPDEDSFISSFNYTWKWIVCRDNNKLTGFARILSDGFYHAYICSMIIAVDSQRLGIGSKMMALIMDEIKKHKLKPLLVAKDTVKGFYKKFGFVCEVDNQQTMIFQEDGNVKNE